ncbi:hypothetical protein BCR36DRAFT_33171 [Piromyces finnis]|uniref:Coth-domain-containing protein n=1 Tax=Piromyces finnis TaxID=1754191 RepID=A0A1Y1VBP8_9FUNG|nr:hypothetical protein BCR36DRAFT_33171 [Piromyces finnis]|eukprot:ORX52081.1 hypothetical protein BCR36DRAFT_33171 [Piromyces finnis]
MKIQNFGIVLSTTLFAFCNAKKYNFNVVSILGTGYSMGVKYDENVVPLQSTLFPLFKGEVEANSINQYKYVALDNKNNIIEEESIVRVYSDEMSNINEVYNRTNKSIDIPELPKPLIPLFPMGSKKLQKLPNNVIYNVYLKCDEILYKNVTTQPFLSSGGNNLDIPCTINIISPDSTFQGEGSVHLIGYGSRLYKKLSWNIKFNENSKKFNGRKSMKLRGIANDYSLMREKLATEICYSLDVPTVGGSYARLFINDDIYGLYLLTDSLNKRWIGAYVHGDEKAKIGFSYTLISSTPNGPYAELKYLGENYKSYKKSGSYQIDEYEKDAVDPNDESTKWTPLIKFTRLYDEWVRTYQNDYSDAAIEALQKFLNIESVLRAMVVDTLTLPLDNFWIIMSNTLLYYNPERDNYQIIPYDFDQSFRGSWEVSFLNASNYIKDCITWANNDEGKFEHYFINHLLEHPQIRKRYDIILAVTLRSTYASKTITDYVQNVAKLIRDDVEWNVNAVDNLNIPYEGKVMSFNLKNFDKSYTKTYVKGASISSSYDFKEFFDIRGDYCREYTNDVDTSDNTNIGEKKGFITTTSKDENKTTEVLIETQTEIQTETTTSIINETETPIETETDTPIEIEIETSTEIEAESPTKTENDVPIPTESLISDSQNFNVVSLMSEEYKIGVMYGEKIIPLNSTLFPLFTGVINGENISEYKYVILNKANEIVEKESISRVYSEETSLINEVYNRKNNKAEVLDLPIPLEQIYPLGSKNIKPIPDNVIYNVYANCDKEGYSSLSSSPFFNGKKTFNDLSMDCTIHIISPDDTFESTGSMKLYGYNPRRFKKLSWIISLEEKPFLGRKSLKMKGIANDNSLMREKFATKLYNAVNVPTQEGAFARLFINNDAYGLYMISDDLTKEWIKAFIHGSENAKIGNNYYKLNGSSSGPFADFKYLGEDYSNYENGVYEIKTLGNNLNHSSQFTELIRFTKLYNDWMEVYQNNTSIESVKALQKFLDVESTLRLLAVETLIIPLDNFWLVSSNTALYYNAEKGLYQFIPYELDQSLVGSWSISSLNSENYIEDCITWANYKGNKNEQFFINHLLEHPLIKKRYDIILAEIVRSTFDSKTIQNYLVHLADLIRDDVQWNIDSVDNLNIPYQGIITTFTMKDFEKNLNYKHSKTHRNSYELWEFVDVRSNYCKIYTSEVDTTEDVFKNSNYSSVVSFSSEIPTETETEIPTETQTEVSTNNRSSN